MFERTLVFLKPNTVLNNESVFCMKWLCKHGFIKRTRTVKKSKKFFLKFYKHVPQPNRDNHSAFCSSGHIVALLLTGDNVVERVKKTIGAANAREATVGTLREVLFSKHPQENGYDNFIHASGSVTDAENEIKIFFGGAK
ncbi:MAG: nucleoside-diphosphate kinase [Caldisericia bacterium]